MKVFKNKLSQTSQFKRFILFGSTGLILILFGIYIGLQIGIIAEANGIANNASEVFCTDKTEALIALIESEKYSLKEKNNAVWALGVLKSKGALPKLESMVTGLDCNHNKEICQYEIKKAILKIKGEFRVSWQARKYTSINE